MDTEDLAEEQPNQDQMVELSETDTESFEDLGPRVSLANGGYVAPVQPVVTNITPTPTSLQPSI